MTCRHHNGRGCSLRLYGGRPSAGVCARCDRYDGPLRGAGDVIHAAAKATGAAKVVRLVTGGKCGGCAKRRAALNQAVPFSTDTSSRPG